MTIRRETEDAQNILVRLEREIYLNMESAPVHIKRQYHKAVKTIMDARHELDLLNDMKDDHRQDKGA